MDHEWLTDIRKRHKHTRFVEISIYCPYKGNSEILFLLNSHNFDFFENFQTTKINYAMCVILVNIYWYKNAHQTKNCNYKNARFSLHNYKILHQLMKTYNYNLKCLKKTCKIKYNVLLSIFLYQVFKLSQIDLYDYYEYNCAYPTLIRLLILSYINKLKTPIYRDG